MVFEFLSDYSETVLFAIRVFLGIIMIYYGLPKIKNLKSNAEDFEKMGFSPGICWGTIVAFIEFFGGIAVLIGYFATIPALLFGLQMILGTVWKITKTKKGFPDWSYDILLVAITAIILTFGAGRFALIQLF